MKPFIHYWPDGYLLSWLLVVFLLDFVFGILKAAFTGQQRTSGRLRQSVIKLLQYGGCVIVAAVILNIVTVSSEQLGRQFAWLFGDIMLYVMIYIEVVSVLENMEAMAPKSHFVRLFVRPVKRIITLQLTKLLKEDD